ncbi:thiamine-monophosphate kinase [Neiella marina]|uniref:Thiamine-monophosphate kinase n=1 Tax=Neiella marina TaxID=508461 RepID=A0A8J2U3S0_9GAMM|nr:thiamine-phosphate kinase [Neiella marina]GGA71457.1 thiamine-monophosphate kinase [Neiella marina]
MNEFDLIQQFFSHANSNRTDVALGIGDDCALLQPKSGNQIAVTTDTMVDGIHFDSRLSPADLAHKLVAVNLSDLAAMGAEPCWVSLALTLPTSDSNWLTEFGAMLAERLQHYGVSLIGGDTTRGPLTLSLTAQGQLPAGTAMIRGGAKPGDLILVSGSLGDAALALQQDKLVALPAASIASLEQRLFRPTPRVELGLAIRALANACIDISDGLSADLNHILARSSAASGELLGAVIDADKLPVSATAVTVLGAKRAALNGLKGGDDYELCFTVSPDSLQPVLAAAEQCNTRVSVIGEINQTGQLAVQYQQQQLDWQAQGYLHFS